MARGFHLPVSQGTRVALGAVNRKASVINAVLTAIGGLMAVTLVALALFNSNLYLVLIREDGVLEAFSAVFWFLAFITSVIGLFLKRGIAGQSLAMAAVMCLIYFMCGGEEISWGQRIFNFAGPEKLIAINKQGETNLHNIGSISVFSNLFFLFTLFFFVWLPWKSARGSAVADSGRRFKLPVVGRDAQRVFLFGLLMWLIIGVRFGTLGFLPFSLWGHYTQMDDEAFEFFASFAFFVFSLLDVTQDNSAPVPALDGA